MQFQAKYPADSEGSHKAKIKSQPGVKGATVTGGASQGRWVLARVGQCGELDGQGALEPQGVRGLERQGPWSKRQRELQLQVRG